MDSGSPDAARQILTAIAAAIITVVGVVFSITIVALILASTQFGPRMLRNFVRRLGIQFTLGVFVATFRYGILAVVTIRQHGAEVFVPHLSITVDFALVLVDLGVLIYFIHHVANSIQLNQVIADIAVDLIRGIDVVDKVRQAGRGMPAVTIRQLEALARIVEFTSDERQRCALRRQADMLLRSSEEAIPEPDDRRDVRQRHAWVLAAMRRSSDRTERALR